MDLVGLDVAAYVLIPNGVDGSPQLGNSYALLGIWKNWELNFDFTRADVTPSAQILSQKRLTGIDWTINVEHLIQSGGTYLGYALFNGQFNLKMVFQEETNGGTFTAYGGIQKGSIARSRDAGMERFTLENIGPVGNTGSSLFYGFNGAASPDQSAQVENAASNVIAARFAALTISPTANVAYSGSNGFPKSS